METGADGGNPGCFRTESLGSCLPGCEERAEVMEVLLILLYCTEYCTIKSQRCWRALFVPFVDSVETVPAHVLKATVGSSVRGSSHVCAMPGYVCFLGAAFSNRIIRLTDSITVLVTHSHATSNKQHAMQ
jgi:hypothetical protein